MLNVLVVCTEHPLPATHGGRVDVLRRLQALRDAGARIGMVCTWAPQRTLVDGLASFRQEFPDTTVDLIGISQGLWDRLRFWGGLVFSRQSLQVRLRDLSPDRWRTTLDLASRSGATVVVADGIFSVPLARRLARSLRLPWVYRAHNIEFQYLAHQARLAQGWRQTCQRWLTARGVEPLERRARADAALVLDISLDDMAWWQHQADQAQRGAPNVRWLPPYGPTPSGTRPAPSDANMARFDLAFLGNLHMPNNVEGLLWFLGEVWPRVLAARPDARLVVAGSQPTQAIRLATARTPGVTLMPDVADPSAVYANARVLINPTRHGSGVNMKSLDLLETGKPVVTCSQGVAGLPAEHQALFNRADSAPGFAHECLKALARPDGVGTASRLPPCYRPQAAHDLIAWLEGLAA